MYSTVLDDPNVDGKILSIPGIRDRGYVQIGSEFLGVVYRVNSTELKIDLKNNKERSLFIVVENMGRLNFGNDLLDSKGILLDVMLDGKREQLFYQYLVNYEAFFDETLENYEPFIFKLSETSLEVDFRPIRD